MKRKKKKKQPKTTTDRANCSESPSVSTGSDEKENHNFKKCSVHSSSKLQALVYDILPSTTAVFSYATEGVLFISAQLSSDAVSALRKVRVLIWL